MNLRDLSDDDLCRAEASADQLLALDERHQILTRELAAQLSTFLADVHAVHEDQQGQTRM